MIKNEARLKLNSDGPSGDCASILVGEVEGAIARPNNGRMPGVDDVSNDMHKNLPGVAMALLATFFTRVIIGADFPLIRKRDIFATAPK